MARWRFQFWLSRPHWLCDLCTSYLSTNPMQRLPPPRLPRRTHPKHSDFLSATTHSARNKGCTAWQRQSYLPTPTRGLVEGRACQQEASPSGGVTQPDSPKQEPESRSSPQSRLQCGGKRVSEGNNQDVCVTGTAARGNVWEGGWVGRGGGGGG